MTELSLCSHLPVLDGINRYDKAGKLMSNMELKVEFFFIYFLFITFCLYLDFGC